MIDAIDVERLLAWLRREGAEPAVLAFVATELEGHCLDHPPSAGPGIPLELSWDERALVLGGMLALACEPRVDERALDRLAAVGRALGYDDDAQAALVRDRLGITERRLRAYAVLGLPLEATRDEVKATHRAIAKAYHPDRLSAADPEARRAAEKLLGKLNHARSVLVSRDEVVLDRPDDIPLDEPVDRPDDVVLDDPSFDREDDEPTEIELDDSLTDQLEECA